MADILTLPADPKFQASVGKVAMLQAKLDYVLVLCIKTLSGAGLKPTRNDHKIIKSQVLRQKVRKLAVDNFDDPILTSRLDALLQRAKAATDERNNLIHNISYFNKNKEYMHQIANNPPTPFPSIKEIDKIASELFKVAYEFNVARKTGFIHAAILRRAARQ